MLVVAGLFFGVMPDAATARTIAIVYDDSGSIRDGINLPAFGTTTLLATLDGQKDRVILMPFRSFYQAFQNHPRVNLRSSSSPKTVSETVDKLDFGYDQTRQLYDGLTQQPYSEERFSDPSAHQAMLNRWGGSLAKVYHGTPFGSIETMLETLRRETGPDEEVHLVILTDGEFLAQNPPRTVRARMIRNFELWANAISSDVSVSYVLILPSSDIGGGRDRKNELLAQVEKEGIREGLLSAFNGAPEDGSYTVDSAQSLWQALQDIIADVARTDRTAQRETISFSGNRIDFKTPFAVTRIIAVATSPDGAAPKFTTSNVSGGTVTQLQTAMTGTDPNYPGVQFQANIVQFRFDPALPAGNHGLEFDSQVRDNVFLLFDTEVDGRVRILDAATGDVAPQDDKGQYILEQDGAYRFATQLIDPKSGKTVALADLPSGTTFSVSLTDGSSLSLQQDAAADIAVAAVNTKLVGVFGARGNVVVPGFVQPKANTVDYEVVSRALVLSLQGEAKAELCDVCGENELRLTIADAGAVTGPISRLTIAADSGQAGEVRLGLSGFPAFVALSDSNGRELKDGDLLPVTAGQSSFDLTLDRRGPLGTAEDKADLGQSLMITLSPSGALKGQTLSVERSLAIVVPDVKIDQVQSGTTDLITEPVNIADKVLITDGGDLEFWLRSIVTDGPKPDDFEISFPGVLPSFIGFDAAIAADGKLKVSPSTPFICLCGVSAYSLVFGSDRRFDVDYADASGLQRASGAGMFRLVHDRANVLPSCLLNLVLALVTIWLAGALVATRRCHRFPRQGYCQEVNGQTDRLFALRGNNMTFLRALLWPVMGVPHEKTTIGPFDLKATSEGVAILLRRDMPMEWRMGDHGKTFAEITKRDPDLRMVDWIWNRSLVNARNKRHNYRVFIAND